MSADIKKIHDKVLTFLIDWRKRNPGFTFTLRKSDLGKKLTEGHWFYENKETIILSFWSGMDWVSRVPNISFCYDLELDDFSIQFSVKDSMEKQDLIIKLFIPHFKVDNLRDVYYWNHPPSFTGKGLIKNLEFFLKTDKIKIDEIIKKNKALFETKQNSRNRIGFISEEEFNKNLKRTLKYRQKQGTDVLPISLVSIQIKDFGPITNLNISEIPINAQWIFLTGENGTGKTSILRAMATAFTNGTLGLGPRSTVSNKYSIRLNLNKYGRNPRHTTTKSSALIRPKKEFKILTEGFVAFGPIRLNISEDSVLFKEPKSKTNDIFKRPHLHLFNTAGFLYDIGTVYNSKKEINGLIKGNEDKIRFIIEAITRICDKITDIQFSKSVRYFEVDSNNNLLNNDGTLFRHLASGYKSIIAMISHMMLHLFYQQPNINDPSELIGIVIIDEIDLHFHPKMQKELVIKLTEVFPRIQFIVSTHSPIPLLGAPINSIILTVKRDAEQGVYIERMDDKIAFENLLPNSLLTSPIFGLNDITPIDHSSNELLRVEDSFNQVQFNLKLEREINEFITDKKEKELMNLFKKKRQ